MTAGSPSAGRKGVILMDSIDLVIELLIVIVILEIIKKIRK